MQPTNAPRWKLGFIRKASAEFFTLRTYSCKFIEIDFVSSDKLGVYCWMDCINRTRPIEYTNVNLIDLKAVKETC